MAIDVDWNAILLGFAVGVPVSTVFFVGLAWGMRQALRSTRPTRWLLFSAACRIAMLLAIGAWITASSTSPWPLAGYALAFFLIRLAAILRARWSPVPNTVERGGAKCS